MAFTGITRMLGQILLDAGIIGEETLAAALGRTRRTNERLGEALIAMRAVSKDDVLRSLAVQVGVPFLPPEEIPSALPVIKTLSPKYLRQYVAVPVTLDGVVVTVATADPTNPVLIDDLHQALRGLQIKFCIAPPEAILDAIERTYGAGATSTLQKIVEGMGAEGTTDGEEDIAHLRDMAFEAPVVRLANLLIEGAVNAEASDIHIEPFEDAMRVRYRIDGILYDQEAPPRRLQAALSSRIKLMAEMNIAERRLPQDGRIRVTLHGRRVDIRVSTVPTVHGESIVMRLLDRSTVFRPFEELGFSSGIDAAFGRLIQLSHGIVLVTGPTGSGKTTTLYAALDKINAPGKKIITAEDPVEYQLKGVNQIPVKSNIGLSFASSLRSILRQDPDVIMVGEIRDLETAEIAIQAALTGHLVFSTLHTNDAPGAVTRLQDMGAESYLLSSVLEGILAQRLLRRICHQCRESHTPNPADLLALGIEEARDVTLYRGRGCETCRGTGYRGRTGIYELLVMTEELRAMVLRRTSAGELRRHAAETAGLITLREDGWAKCRAGVTSVEELLRVTQEEN
jgi:type II secretion system protein E